MRAPADIAPRAPSVAPPPAPAHHGALVLTAVLSYAVVRIALFPFAENLFGDAIVRSELAARWLEHPHVIRSFQDGTFQFGPLHLYWMAPFLKLWPSLQHASRLASLVAALLTLIPVYRIARRLFSPRAAAVTLLCFATWGLHIQASTTAASEALFLALFFLALDALTLGIRDRRLAPLAVAALFANLLCATRYDGWLYAPLFALAVAAAPGRRRTRLAHAAFFAALCAPWPLWWSYESWRATGDPLYAVHYIDAFHRTWTRDGIAWLGPLRFRAMALFFWPGSLLATASLFVGAFSIAGIVRAFVRHERRLLALLAIVPAAYFTFRAAVLMDFSPLARFTMVQVALALFYAADGFDGLCRGLGRDSRRAVAGAAALVAVATPLALGAFTAWRTGGLEETLRPITPLSTIPTAQRAAAHYLRDHVAADEAVVIDFDSAYADLSVAYFSGLPEARMVRRRWDDFEPHLARAGAAWLVVMPGGALQLAAGEPGLEWRGAQYDLVSSPGDGLFMYRREEPAPSADSPSNEEK